MIIKRQNSSAWIEIGPMIDASDGKTPLTELVLTAYISKNGAAQITRNEATAITHDRDGWYRVKLNSTDYNTAGHLQVQLSATATAIAAWKDVMVMPETKYDVLYGSDNFADQILEGSYSEADMLRGIFAQTVGPTSGEGTTLVKFMNPSKTRDRVTMNLTTLGGRSTVTLDLTS